MLKRIWSWLKKHGIQITVVLMLIGLVLAFKDHLADWLKTEKDKAVKLNLLAKVEFNLCELIKRDLYCPIFIYDATLGDTSGLDKAQAREANDIFGQISSYRTDCLNMDNDTRRITIDSLYQRTWSLRNTGVVVRPRYVEMAIDFTPPPNMTWEEAADKCHKEIRGKSTIRRDGK